MTIEQRATARRRIDWPAVRADYEAGASTVAQIAARFGLARHAIQAKAKAQGWTPRRPAAGRKLSPRMALKRTRALIARHLDALERGGGDDGNDSLARVRAISQLLKLIDQVTKLERQNAADRRGRRRGPRGLGDQAMRDAIARRIEGLAALDADGAARGAEP